MSIQRKKALCETRRCCLPSQRNPLYEILRTFDDDAPIDIPETQRVDEENKLAILSNIANP